MDILDKHDIPSEILWGNLMNIRIFKQRVETKIAHALKDVSKVHSVYHDANCTAYAFSASDADGIALAINKHIEAYG